MKMLRWIGALVFLGVAVLFVCECGPHWTVGRYYMPSSQIAADGRTYLDGSKADELILALAQSGWEEEVFLVGLILLIVLCGDLTWKMCRKHRTQAKTLHRESGPIHAKPWYEVERR